ncbi:MAG TPA: Uma2 family endonuclease [Pyrinomonadaceae bacterium]|nr:Uma2 family endonuclease [Pyrinomonadaceae bacterium]
MATEVIEQPTEERLTRQRATPEEFWSLPESVLSVEYINGEIIMSPSPTVAHQSASRNIFRALDKSLSAEAADRIFYAPLDVVLPSGDVVQPDILFLAEEDARRATRRDRVRCVPLFVVEILSPSSITLDAITKRELYEKNGVREYWIVNLEARSIAQFVLKKKHYALTELGESDLIKGAVLAGFEAGVGELLGA